MKNRKMSHELQQLYLLNQRTLLDEKTKFHYQNLYLGYLGEIHMDKLVDTFCDGLEYLNDLTLVFKETMVQIDKIILVNHTVFLIDMKYYRGHYLFQNNNWYKDDKILLTNILEQLRKAKRLLQNVFNTHQIPLKVEGVLAFMNPDANIEILDEVPEKILLYQNIPNWLYELKNMQESNTRLHWQRTLLQYTVAPFRTKKDYPIENINHLKKGICCCACHNFQTIEKSILLFVLVVIMNSRKELILVLSVSLVLCFINVD